MGDEGRATPAAGEIEGRLLWFIRSELLGAETRLGPDDELLSGSLLDSIAVLRLAAFVADDFGFEVRPSDFVIENFRSVSVLAEYVERAVRQAG